jgi:hypothetical protein
MPRFHRIDPFHIEAAYQICHCIPTSSSSQARRFLVAVPRCYSQQGFGSCGMRDWRAS